MNPNLLYLAKVGIVFSVLSYLWFAVSPYSYDVTALDAPVKLGETNVLHFKAARSEPYVVKLKLESDTLSATESDRISCLLRARPSSREQCAYEPIGVRWRVLDAGQPLASGGNHSASATVEIFGKGAIRSFGAFDARRGRAYRLELDLTDSAAPMPGATNAHASISLARYEPGAEPSLWRSVRMILHGLAAIGVGLLVSAALSRFSERRNARRASPPGDVRASAVSAAGRASEPAPAAVFHVPGHSSKSYLTGAGLIGLLMVATVNGAVFMVVGVLAMLALGRPIGDNVVYALIAVLIGTTLTAFMLVAIDRMRAAYALLISTSPIATALVLLLMLII